MATEPKVGDWAVWGSLYSYGAGDIRRLTEKCFWSHGHWSSRDHRYDRSKLLFAGSEAAAKKLKEQLISSSAQYDEERRKAGVRKRERDQRFIAEAEQSLKRDMGEK